MLSAHDAELVGRDRGVPGLAVLLDTDAFLELLSQEFPDLSGAGVVVTYVRYKPGTSCLCAYRIVAGGRVHDVYAKAFRSGRPEKLRHWRAAAEADRGDPGRRLNQRWHVGISRFPDDRRLKALWRLQDAAMRDRVLAKVFEGDGHRRFDSLVTLRYKPERRYVASLTEDGAPAAVLKMYDGPGYDDARARARLFSGGDSLQVARLAGESAADRILAFDWVAGRSLHEELTRGDVVAAEIAGVALGELHDHDLARSMDVQTNPVSRAVHDAAGSVAAVQPALADAARALAGSIASLLDESPQSLRPGHGDFYAEQVIVAGNRAAVLDFDRAGLAHPAADLGTFAAHARRDAMRASHASGDPAAAEGAVLAGYTRSRQAPPLAQIRAYTAAALLRLAPEPFRRREDGWPEATAALLEQAARLLEPRRLPSRERAASPAGDAVVYDAPALASDPTWAFLRDALDPRAAPRHLAPSLARADATEAILREIRVSRHKPGRRCIVEYAFETSGAPHGLVILGKSRIKGLAANGHFALESLWDAGFRPSRSPVCVPQPLGAIPAWRMTLQRKVKGDPASAGLAGPDGAAIAARAAEAIHLLHTKGIAPIRAHTVGDELRILRERLSQLVELFGPARIQALLYNCVRIAAQLPRCRPRPVHRDFYPAHVLVDGERLWLIDLDLYSAGDPALDAGNFLAHMIEERLRREGTADGLSDTESAFESRYAQLAESHVVPAIRIYTTLSLTRHVHLSTQYPERLHTTEALLELCERRLSAALESRLYA